MTRPKAVFFDRDGVLNRYLPGAYVERPDQLELVDGAAVAIKNLNEAGIPAIVISNQQGVGKGLMSVADLDVVEESLKAKLYDVAGARLTGIYHCTHLKEDRCTCRKPAPGMILDALRDHDLTPQSCAFIGDSAGDIQAASAAAVGLKLLVLSGGTNFYLRGAWSIEPDAVFVSAKAAVDWLLEAESD